ncbi:MAG: hypothetical protein AAF958_01335 [Planctomycetota bacterium]
MLLADILRWFLDSWGDLTRYFSTMTTWQWGIASGCVMIFSFLCLRGYRIEH